MRELKFRAWDKIDKIMVSGSDYFSSMDFIYPIGFQVKDHHDIIIMQYTGLKDKNGKEIYEGDWIKTKTGYIDFVRWSDDYAGFFPFFVSGINESDLEIIGNVYENKIEDFICQKE